MKILILACAAGVAAYVMHVMWLLGAIIPLSQSLPFLLAGIVFTVLLYTLPSLIHRLSIWMFHPTREKDFYAKLDALLYELRH